MLWITKQSHEEEPGCQTTIWIKGESVNFNE
jgi:hypothetical protein